MSGSTLVLVKYLGLGDVSVRTDGSAGDADYGRGGTGYWTYRQAEPDFEAAIEVHLGDARSVVNVGAGAGSYELRDRIVTPV